MCLTKKSYIPRIAIRDITTYKVVTNPDDCLSEHYFTPFQVDVIKLGRVYKGRFRKYMWYGFKLRTRYTDGIFNIPFLQFLLSIFFSKVITSGYIHSYTSYDPVVKLNLLPDVYSIVQCVIPRGTLYFIGRNNDIASRKLKYVEIIR